MLSQAIERPIIVASLSGRTLESLTIDNLIWPSVLNYLDIKEDIMEIPGKIRALMEALTNNQCPNLIFCFIFYIFLISVNVVFWYTDLELKIALGFRIIIAIVSLALMTFTLFKCMLPQCLENQEDIIKDRVIAEFNEKCKFYQVSHCFFSLCNFLVLSLHHSNHFIKSQILLILTFFFSIPCTLRVN